MAVLAEERKEKHECQYGDNQERDVPDKPRKHVAKPRGRFFDRLRGFVRIPVHAPILPRRRPGRNIFRFIVNQHRHCSRLTPHPVALVESRRLLLERRFRLLTSPSAKMPPCPPTPTPLSRRSYATRGRSSAWRALLATVAWIGIAALCLANFRPPRPVDVFDPASDEPELSVVGTLATFVELVVFVGFITIWRRIAGPQAILGLHRRSDLGDKLLFFVPTATDSRPARKSRRSSSVWPPRSAG